MSEKLLLLELASRVFQSMMFAIVGMFLCSCTTHSQESKPAENFSSVGKIPILVVDELDKPIPGVKLVPWALRSGQGHGVWGAFEGKPDVSGMDPISEMTDQDGTAEILYPILRDAKEQVKTLSVSIRFEHLQYSCGDTKHIDVPLADDGPYKVVMTATASIDLKPMIDGKAVPLDEIYAFWSNPRSWSVEGAPEKLASGHLRIHGFLPGENQVLLARMVDDCITHFSDVGSFDVKRGSVHEVEMELVPSVQIVGRLSDNVPRPIRLGRVVARNIPPSSESSHLMWTDWAEVSSDGEFVFNSWPRCEAIQIIALCDGFIATSGKAPTPDLKQSQDYFYRPHTFNVSNQKIVIPMTALVPVTVTATSQDNAPVSGLDIAVCPNVGWWNYGSQIYGLNMVRGRKLLSQREFRKIAENPYPSMFRGLTDSRGKVTFQLPEDTQYLELLSDQYELPIELGSRMMKLRVVDKKPIDLTLRVQPIGTEQLGDWDRLAGLVYGCSTIEGRKLLELPGMKEKVDEFVKKFSDAKNQQDPELLSEAYLSLSEAFQNANEQEEALKWKMKALDLKKK
ncbi:MAG: hypothetical protein MUC83_01855 [Pirellula sp.]|jgi:hypothetical protein|nr:hypothetical protein [Pirellula sp.]